MKYKNQIIIGIIILILSLSVNLLVLRDYRLLLSNHNTATAILINDAKESMLEFVEASAMNASTSTVKTLFEDTLRKIRILEINLRDSSFTKNSIDKEILYGFIYKLSNVGEQISLDDILIDNKKIRTDILDLFKLFQQQIEYGTSSQEIFKISKVILIYENNVWNKMESLLSNIETELSYYSD